ncbi:hypothetical protein ACFOSS_11450 [Pseudaeromonas sharmana]|uniref:Nif11 domain-containing protein n=1 Tax=Pseudaeromonas sharmana TaxID=328412 RepID=A0ABV8CPD6_9GAMM
MQRIDYTRLKDQVFDVLDNCGSPYQETRALCIDNNLPFGLREEEMVSNAISEYHGWKDNSSNSLIG